MNSPDLSNRGGIPGMDRRVELRIHITYPNDRAVGNGIGVSLVSTTGSVVSQYFTNGQGEVTFTGIAPGAYSIKVTGSDIKDLSTDTLYIDRNQPNRTEWVRVEPKEEQATSKQGMVSAAALKIPEKARKEVEKANEAFAAGNITKAIDKYQKAIKIYPEYSVAYNNLGAAYMRANDIERARESFAKAAEIDPRLSSANANLARLQIRDKNFGQAVLLLDRALSSTPNDAELLLLMADAQFESGQMDRAVSYARKLHTGERHQFAVSHLLAARALEAENRREEARVEYQVFIKEAPDSKEIQEARQAVERLDVSAQRSNAPLPR